MRIFYFLIIFLTYIGYYFSYLIVRMRIRFKLFQSVRLGKDAAFKLVVCADGDINNGAVSICYGDIAVIAVFISKGQRTAGWDYFILSLKLVL